MATLTHLIFYVEDVMKGITFYQNAFGFEPKFIHESEQYGEMNTGEVTLAFASDSLGKANLPDGYLANKPGGLPQASEAVFTVKDVQKSYQEAIRAGASSVAQPKEKPWGQTVGYVRDPNGVLIEIASEMT